MKRTILLPILMVWATFASGQTAYDENENISNIPSGISYQTGPGGNNTLNWTYPYGTKLTVSDGNCCRNFEIGINGYQSNFGDLIFRYWDAVTNTWKPWQKVVLKDQNGIVELKGSLITPNPTNTNANVNFSWHNNVARVRIGGTGEGASNGLDIQTVGDQSLMRILHSGLVGIGTTTPDAKLTVNGDIHTKEVRVDLDGVFAPDYVFAADYDLKSLEEVQNYIQEHGHLPNIPSAREMEENGLLLKEMNLKLLEKIEELTLYLIQLKKENDQIIKLLELEK